MLEDKVTRWKEAVSRGSSFLIENLLRSTVRETLTEKEEEEKEEDKEKNPECRSPFCNTRGESLK